MIISASYKTDIPAFYGQWFVNRLRAGYCLMRNPMNRKEIRLSMTPEEVDGIVFWTKNFRPFVKHLPQVAQAGLPFIVQYTINGYPRSLENHVVEWQRTVETVAELAGTFGSRCVVWRYDTVILSDQTPRSFHIENFGRLANALKGLTDEVVLSFLQLYRKTERNLNKMANDHGNAWRDPSLEEKQSLAAELFAMARAQGMKLTICSQPEIMTVQSASRCIDSQRLMDVGLRPFKAKTCGNRPGCECAASRDIGDYDTCPHGCVYCYAVRSQEVALRRFRDHDPDGEYLFVDGKGATAPADPDQPQLRLFS